MPQTEAAQMTLPEVVAYARSAGLTHVKYQGIEVQLGPVPTPAAPVGSTDDEVAQFFDDGPSDECLLFYSSGNGPPTPAELAAYQAAHPEAIAPAPTPKKKRKV
jgi:hypothetical protein